MIGHHDISVDAKLETVAHTLKGVLKDASTGVGGEQGAAMVTAESYEVALPRVVITFEAPRHEASVIRRRTPSGAAPFFLILYL